jgi:hypothetical protein
LKRTLLQSLIFVCITATARVTRSEEQASPDTFEYVGPTEKNYLRALLELTALTSVGVAWYAIDVKQGANVDYRWQMFDRKLSGTAIGHDDNAFGTNFRGHGVGGNVYYLAARSNHLSIAESFGFAVAGATLWEYFGEIGEIVSVNDLIYTPLSGIGIGEPLTQFGSYFDRRPPSFVNSLFGTLFAPIKTVNNALDGAHLSRDSNPRNDWHRFRLAASPMFTRSEFTDTHRVLANSSNFRFDWDERLARLPDYDDAGERDELFVDGNLSGMSLRAAYGDRSFSDFAFSTSVVPFGYYRRSAQYTPGGLRGSGLVLGFELGYRYLVHRYLDGSTDMLDRAAFVRPLGAMFEFRGHLGFASITTRVDLLAAYGGVHPLASRAFGADHAKLPLVLSHFDYYFGAGGELEASLEVGFHRLQADGSLLARRFSCIDEHAQLPIRDSWERYVAGLSYRIEAGWSARLFAESGVRAGRLGDARARARETTSGLELRTTF